MRRWVLSAALCALLTLPVWGQRGGGGHGGMGGGGARGVSGGGYHSGGYAGGSSYRGAVGYSRAPGYAGAYRGGYWNGYRGGYAWRGYPYRGYPYAGYGWRWGYPWWGFGYAGWGWGYPWWGWGGSYYDNSYYNYYPSDAYPAQAYPAYTYPPADAGDYSQDNQTQDQIDRLTGEVNQLRSQQSLGQSRTAEIHAETVLVYRDGHTEEVQNYAIVGKTIWIFNEARARKVAISELDVPATKRDNEDRGIDFVLPGSSR
ncbi:MAG: hypothetical protein WAM65_00435 [Candidatus Korobacteraceae bacterium]